jgi:hypothetical protein
VHIPGLCRSARHLSDLAAPPCARRQRYPLARICDYRSNPQSGVRCVLRSPSFRIAAGARSWQGGANDPEPAGSCDRFQPALRPASRPPALLLWMRVAAGEAARVGGALPERGTDDHLCSVVCQRPWACGAAAAGHSEAARGAVERCAALKMTPGRSGCPPGPWSERTSDRRGEPRETASPQGVSARPDAVGEADDAGTDGP